MQAHHTQSHTSYRPQSFQIHIQGEMMGIDFLKLKNDAIVQDTSKKITDAVLKAVGDKLKEEFAKIAEEIKAETAYINSMETKYDTLIANLEKKVIELEKEREDKASKLQMPEQQGTDKTHALD